MTQLSWIGLWLESISFAVSQTNAVSLTSHCKNHITCIFLLFFSSANGIPKQFPSLFAPFNQKESALLVARELTIDTLLLDSHHPAARTSMAACPYQSGPPGHPHRSPVKRSNDSRRKNHLGEATQAVNWLASQSHINISCGMPLWVLDGEPSLVISTNDNDQRLIIKSSKARNAKPNVNQDVGPTTT